VSKLAAFRSGQVTWSQDFRGKGSSLENIFLVSTKLDTFCYPTVQTAAKLCGVEQRAPPMFGRAAITLGIGLHSSGVILSYFFRAHNGHNIVIFCSSVKHTTIILKHKSTIFQQFKSASYTITSPKLLL